MAATVRYPDFLRQQAIALYQQGKGYRAIGHELGLTRDTVRNWINSYRLTGRTESVETTGQLRNGPSYQRREERFAAAREEYESSSAKMQASMDAQMAAIQQQGDEYLAQMREELANQLERLQVAPSDP